MLLQGDWDFGVFRSPTLILRSAGVKQLCVSIGFLLAALCHADIIC